MHFKYLITFFLFFWSFTSLAQNGYVIKGILEDEVSKVHLARGTISVLDAKDSILKDFGYSSNIGTFTFTKLSKGSYILLVTYPNYVDYVENFVLDSLKTTYDFNVITMKFKSRLLQEVIIKGQTDKIKIKGDTTEYDAKSFVIQPNAKVEDLLKQLPGIHIDKNGQITALGEKIRKVLVDGEEFFGDDPTLVTRNLRADMVDKIDLYDQKSAQASFTGIDDGIKMKTLNVRLKEDKKNGVFGKVNAGIAKNYFEGQAMYNKFKNQFKFSAFALTANTGKIGLGFEDNNKLGTSGDNLQVRDDGGFSYSSSDDLDSFSGTYNGQGLPSSRSAGVHFDDKWNNDKRSANINYKIVSLDVDAVSDAIHQQNLPSNLITSISNKTSTNAVLRQKVDGSFRIKLDTTSTISIDADITRKMNKTKNNYFTTTNRNDTLLSKNSREITNNNEISQFYVNSLYAKKMKKQGRTFSLNVSFSNNRSYSSGYLISEIDFFNALGAKDSSQVIDQYKIANNINTGINTNLTYTEPLTKNASVLFNYGFALSNSTSDRQSFNKSLTANYDIFDSEYSNKYTFDRKINQFGAIFNIKKNKMTYNFGTKLYDIKYEQLNEYTKQAYNRSFINWAPQMRYQYNMSSQKSFSINYNGNTTQPNIDQLQPIKINNDPLNIILGNVDLKPSFTNRLTTSLRSYKSLNEASFSINASYSFISNAIVNNSFTDVNGKSINQYINFGDKNPYNISVSSSWGRKVKPLDISISLDLSLNKSISYNYINNSLNKSQNENYSATLTVQKEKENKYSIYIYGGPSYYINQFSLQKTRNNNSLGLFAYGSGNFFLPGKFEFELNVVYSYNARTEIFSAQNRTILNTSIKRSFTKSNNLKLSIIGNDLLNQNMIFDRGLVGNTSVQTTFNSIKRYFMFSISWDFTKFKTKTTEE